MGTSLAYGPGRSPRLSPRHERPRRGPFSARVASARSVTRDLACLALLTGLSACAADLPDATTLADDAPEIEATSDSDLVLPIPLDVPYDRPRAALGERLFRDPLLSHDGQVRCASCHDLAQHGGADGLVHSALPGRPAGPINVPTVFNVALNFRWSWSGHWEHMSDQIDAAMEAPHAMATSVDDALPRLEATYAHDFAAVYPEGLTADTVRDALGEYLHSLTTPNARFDQFLRGRTEALTDDEQRGWTLFREIGCVSCHQGMNVGGNLFQRFGVVDDYIGARREPTPADLGRARFTHLDADRLVFRVPSLRNVALTAPYFHDGSAPTLERAVQVMAHYQLGRRLPDDDVRLLVAFLGSLTGELPAAQAP
jgi:cytochrome c peroxidase